MEKEVIIIEVERTGYSVNQVGRTATVKDLKQWLEDYDDEDETPIYVSHDNGYTYGPLNLDGIRTEEVES